MTWQFGRAPKGGLLDVVNNRSYKGGELLPFYVPRPVMPQIEETDMDDFVMFVDDIPIEVRQESFDPWDLRPHQRIDPIHSEKMPPWVLAKPIFISQDRYVLDGNHRWLAHLMAGTPLSCWMIMQPFAQAIETMFQFPRTTMLLTTPEKN